MARRGVRSQGDGIQVEPHLGAAVTALAKPALLCFAARENGTALEWRRWAILPPVAVACRPLVGDLHDLELFDPGEIVEHVFAFIELENRPPPGGAPFELTVSALEHVARCLTENLPEEADGALLEGGAPPDSGQRFLAALRAKRGSVELKLIWRDGPVTLRGCDLTWVDGGLSGLWLTPTPPVLPDQATPELPATYTRIRVEPTSAASIREQFMSALPSALQAAPTPG